MRSTIELFSGFVAGCTTTLICQPIDRVKVRRQVEIGCVVGSRRSLGVVHEIWASEGLYGFYRGFVPNLVGNASCWALYFMWYEMAKSYASSFRGEKHLNSVDYFLASASSSIFTSICTNPIWVMKTRMLAHKPGITATPSSWLRETKLILYHDGIGGLYRGLVPSLLGAPQYAIQFSVYEQLKIWRGRNREALSNLDISILSVTSKLFAGALMYPHQVLRSKIQNSQIGCRLSTWSLAKTIQRKEGFRGFYRGIVPTLLRNIPSTCVTFVVFENINNMMRSRDSGIVKAI